MLTARECREKADTLKAMAAMFPERAGAYAEAEQRWRHLERLALDTVRGPSAPGDPGAGRSV